MTTLDEATVPARRDDDATPLTCICVDPILEDVWYGALCCTICHRPPAWLIEHWLTRPGGPRA